MPTRIFGEIPAYIIESFFKALLVGNVMGLSIIFIMCSITLCTHFEILAVKIEFMKGNEEKLLNELIEEHNRLLR